LNNQYAAAANEHNACAVVDTAAFFMAPGLVAVRDRAVLAAALVEIVGRWQVVVGVRVFEERITSEGGSQTASCGSETVAGAWGRLSALFEELFARSPTTKFAADIVRGVISGDMRKRACLAENGGMLRGSLWTMRCALRSCSGNNGINGSNDDGKDDEGQRELLACSGGCGGLARYCCVEHQAQHWEVHKLFCKRNARANDARDLHASRRQDSKKDKKKKKKKKKSKD
jgi:hypothetical protein